MLLSYTNKLSCCKHERVFAFDNQTENDPLSYLIKYEIQRKLKNSTNSMSLDFFSFTVARLPVEIFYRRKHVVSLDSVDKNIFLYLDKYDPNGLRTCLSMSVLEIGVVKFLVATRDLVSWTMWIFDEDYIYEGYHPKEFIQQMNNKQLKFSSEKVVMIICNYFWFGKNE